MGELANLLTAIVTPVRTGAHFPESTIHTSRSFIGAYGFSRYEHMNRSHWDDLPSCCH